MTRLWTLGGVCGAAALALAVTLPAAGAADGAADSPANPTFTKDVLPILQRSCQDCHRPGEIGPFSLLTYEDARPWARSIQQKVSNRDMPPWFSNRAVGEYDPDPSLSDTQVATIVKW